MIVINVIIIWLKKLNYTKGKPKNKHKKIKIVDKKRRKNISKTMLAEQQKYLKTQQV